MSNANPQDTNHAVSREVISQNGSQSASPSQNAKHIPRPHYQPGYDFSAWLTKDLERLETRFSDWITSASLKKSLRTELEEDSSRS